MYEVAPNPRTSKGKDSLPYTRWTNKWDKKLIRLSNGFTIFLTAMFEINNITMP